MRKYSPLRTFLSAAIVSAVVLSAVAAGAQGKLRLANALAPASHFGVGAAAFKDELVRLTGERLGVEIFSNAVLGGERDVIEGLQLGTIDVTVTSSGPVGHFVPDALIFDVPFLFKDRTHAHAVLDGPIGQAILDKFPAQRLVALAWGESGFRHLTNSRQPVTTPADLKGLTLRTMENEIHIQAFRALGALPAPLPFNELFAALQQGIVNGQENPISTIVTAKFTQVQKYLTLTGHAYTPALFLISKITFDKLSADDKNAVTAAGKAAAQAQRRKVEELEASGMEEIRKQGMETVTEVDKAAFRQALVPAYEIYAKKFGQDKLDAIINFTP